MGRSYIKSKEGKKKKVKKVLGWSPSACQVGRLNRDLGSTLEKVD